MKKMHCVFILLFMFSALKSQQLMIKEITISKVIVNIEEFIDNDLDEGPLLQIKGSIANNTNMPISITPSNSDFYASFEYNGCIYYKEIISSGFILDNKNGESIIRPSILFKESEVLIINPLESMDFYIDSRILWKTNILEKFNGEHYDYSKQLLQVLPTLKIVFKSPNFKLISKSIDKVNLADDYEYTPR